MRWLSSVVVALVACGSNEEDVTCGVPGVTQACLCAGAASGAQACGADGRWSACECRAPEDTTITLDSEPPADATVVEDSADGEDSDDAPDVDATPTSVDVEVALEDVEDTSEDVPIEIEVELDDCIGHACTNGGACVDGDGAYTCDCPRGYGGEHCEVLVDLCLEGPDCHNGACIYDLEGARCVCERGWQGELCDVDIDECAAEPCEVGTCYQEGLGAYTCVDCSPHEVPCQVRQSADLELREEPSSLASIELQSAGPDFNSATINAGAGGFTLPLGSTYVRFGDDALELVDIDDVAAFDSMVWDVAFRRTVVRLNGGVAGPSCVAGAKLAPGTSFTALEAVPAGTSFATESYVDAGCGPLDTPEWGYGVDSVLSGFMQYTGCVSMTGRVFVVRLADGRVVKLEVLAYYDAASQAACEDTGAASNPGTAGTFSVRWAFITP